MSEEIRGKARSTVVWISLVGVFALLPAVSAMGEGMRFPLAISYVSGVDDLVDQYEANLEFDGWFEYDNWQWPVGLAFQPYYQWDNGVRLGMDVGPIIAIFGDTTHWQVPLNVNLGYTFNEEGSVAFFVRAGPSFHVADGDYYERSKVGVMAGIGLEFFRSDHTAIGIQAMYDSAKVEIADLPNDRIVGIRAAEFSAGVYFLFK